MTRTPEQMEQALRQIGAEMYHNLHPFHKRLHSGGCTKDEVRAWALNRYCYQRIIPIKDAAMLARLESVEMRRVWRQRIVDHDGEIDDHPEGGLRRWLALCDGLGFDRAYVRSMRGALPATVFACDAYVKWVKEKSELEAVASSLTEMFSPTIIAERVSGMLANYDFISEDILKYFNFRLSQAPRDAEWALAYVQKHALTEEQQEAALNALRFKCGMLWCQLDALQYCYVEGNHFPGAWKPGEGMA